MDEEKLDSFCERERDVIPESLPCWYVGGSHLKNLKWLRFAPASYCEADQSCYLHTVAFNNLYSFHTAEFLIHNAQIIRVKTRYVVLLSL